MVDLVTAGLLLVLAGMAVLLVGVLADQKDTRSQVKGGGVLLIGPVPIAFGTDAKWTSIAIALAIALVAVTFLVRLV